MSTDDFDARVREVEDDREERAVNARRDRLWEAAQARTGEGRGALIAQAAGLNPVSASLTALRVALDAAAQACGLPAGAPPSVVEFAATRDRELAEAVRAWRDVDRDHGTDGPGWDALLRLRDAADRYAGLGIGDVA